MPTATISALRSSRGAMRARCGVGTIILSRGRPDRIDRQASRTEPGPVFIQAVGRNSSASTVTDRTDAVPFPSAVGMDRPLAQAEIPLSTVGVTERFDRASASRAPGRAHQVVAWSRSSFAPSPEPAASSVAFLNCAWPRVHPGHRALYGEVRSRHRAPEILREKNPALNRAHTRSVASR